MKIILLVTLILGSGGAALAGPKPKRIIDTDFSREEPTRKAERDPNATVVNVKETAKPTYRPADEYDEVRMISTSKRKPASRPAEQSSTNAESAED